MDPERLKAAWYEKMAQMASETPPDIGQELEGIEDEDMAAKLKETLQKARVRWLWEEWEAWRVAQGCTVPALRRLIEAQPYCLWECKAFTSEKAMRRHLNKHKGCIVPKYIAKEFQLIKSCMVKLR